MKSWLAEQLPNVFEQEDCEVVALELERAFWEKATILHAEYHREPIVAMPPNYSRHYADVSAMAEKRELVGAFADTELRQRVVDWKSKFFARSWARYDLAEPGTFRLVPPTERLAELAGDYRQMREMFLDEPPTFDQMMNTLSDLEKRINES